MRGLFRPRAWLLVVWVFFGGSFEALCEDLRFDHLSVADGLSHQVVTCIFQDSSGFLWFGTRDGLNRYDGNEVVVYRHDPAVPGSLSANYIRAILEAEDGSFWVGTDGGGVNVRWPSTEGFRTYRHNPDDATSLGHNEVMSLAEDDGGLIWLGTMGGGLDVYDGETRVFRHYRHDPSDPRSLSHDIARVLLVDSEGVLWVGTRGGGLNRFDALTDSFAAYRHDPLDPTTLDSDDVVALHEGRDGTLWVGTFSGGLNACNRKTGRCRPYSHRPGQEAGPSSDRVWAILEDQRGRIWVGAYGGGLDVLAREGEGMLGLAAHHEHDPSDPGSLIGNHVRAVYQGPSGVLWIGTESGVSKTFPRREAFRHVHSEPGQDGSLSSDSVWAFEEDRQGRLWVGTEAGLNRYDRRTGLFTRFRHRPGDVSSLSHDEVWTLLEDRSGFLWIGTYGGLDRYDPGTGRFRHYLHDPGDPRTLSNKEVWCLLEDDQGVLWVGTYQGLNRLDRRTGFFTRYWHDPQDPASLSDNGIYALLQDSQGMLWIGTYRGGLNRLDRDSGRFSSFRHDPQDPNTISSDKVRVVLEDSDGSLWVGTEIGLDRFDGESGTFLHVGVNNGRGLRTVLGLLEDREGFLWASTRNGLYRVDRTTLETFCFDENEGLQANEFHQGAALRNSRGELIFGGVNGFSAFRPEEVQPRSYQPPILLTRFKVFDRDRKPPQLEPGGDSGITISHRENFFSFEFAALDFVAPERIQYAYRMEGFDQDWIESGNRRYASYTNLDPGSYVFRVKATNSDGIWNKDGLELAVTITPPYWQTWWFRVLGLTLALGGVFGAYRLRVRHLEERERTLSRLLDERTRHLTEREQELERALEDRNLAYCEVERLARTDPLTGLWNRRAILERMEEEKLRSDRNKVPFAVIMADIDDFKAFNDRYGHQVGDAVLVHVSKLIEGAVRQVDAVARWGGEEIVLVLPGTTAQGGMTTANMLRKKVEEGALEMEGRVFNVRMTLGVTSYQPPMTTQQCIQLADEAMLEGKRLGKNCVRGKRFGFAASG